ncbi:MAG: hypothetical protein JXA81_05885 [Sedimentisphaerales bacterium]|nr:hypothetical protein [Sedimentisphaerales bacterium]
MDLPFVVVNNRNQMNIEARQTIPKLYYYITPIFILLDYVLGISIRVTVLDSMPMYKNLYYGFCILCGVFVYTVPKLTPAVALFESSINFLITVLAVFMPYINFISKTDDYLMADLPAAAGFDTPHIVNILLAGTIAILGFHGSIKILGIHDKRPHSKTGRKIETDEQ